MRENDVLVKGRRESSLSVNAWQPLALQEWKFKEAQRASLRAAEHIRDAK